MSDSPLKKRKKEDVSDNEEKEPSVKVKVKVKVEAEEELDQVETWIQTVIPLLIEFRYQKKPFKLPTLPSYNAVYHYFENQPRNQILQKLCVNYKGIGESFFKQETKFWIEHFSGCKEAMNQAWNTSIWNFLGKRSMEGFRCAEYILPLALLTTFVEGWSAVCKWILWERRLILTNKPFLFGHAQNAAAYALGYMFHGFPYDGQSGKVHEWNRKLYYHYITQNYGGIFPREFGERYAKSEEHDLAQGGPEQVWTMLKDWADHPPKKYF